MWRHIRRDFWITGCLVVLAFFAAGTAAQDAEGAAPSPVLTGSTWRWERFVDPVKEIRVLADQYTITFAEDGRFHAQADCNQVLGSYSADAGTISIRPGPSTLVACPPASLGDDFVRYLSQAVIYSFTDDGKLLLELPVDSGTLTFSAQPQVTGTLTYLVRMALPPDAVVRVQIQDVSRADAPMILIGEQVFVTDGAQVPLPFAVSYPTDLEPGRRYTVAARITDADGRLLFISDTIIPVITDDNPTSDIEIVLVPVGS